MLDCVDNGALSVAPVDRESEMALPDRVYKIETQVGSITKDMASLKKSVDSLLRKPEIPASPQRPAPEQPTYVPDYAPDNWVKRNSYWFWPVITLAFGSGAIFSFFHWFF